MTIMESGGRENFQPRLASPLSTPDSLAAPKTKTGEGLLANAFLERFCALFFSILMPGCRTCRDFAIGGKEKRKKAKSNKVAGLEFLLLLLLLLLRGRFFSPFPPPPPTPLSSQQKKKENSRGTTPFPRSCSSCLGVCRRGGRPFFLSRLPSVLTRLSRARALERGSSKLWGGGKRKQKVFPRCRRPSDRSVALSSLLARRPST